MSDDARVDSADAVVGSAGSLLRAARERQGMHIAALAAALKVAPRKLELLETDRYDELHDATFVRALALSMCRALRIDAQPVLSRLPQAGGQRLEDVNRGLNQPFRDRMPVADAVEWPRYLSAPVIAAIVLVVAAIALYLLPARSWWPMGADKDVAAGASAPGGEVAGTASSSGGEASSGTGVIVGLATSAVEAAASVIAPAASTPATAAKPAVPSTAAPAPAPVAAPAAAVPATTAPAAATVPTPAPVAAAPVSAPVTAPPAAAAGVLKMHAQAESWVEVRDRDGRVIVQRTLAAGESVAADGVPPFRVTVGNASGTQVEFRGQPVVLAPIGRDNVARLELR
jgi:cytoskeleton protein RodZ